MVAKPESHSKQRCLALTRRGTPCRNWAMPGTQAHHGRPLCRAHLPSPGQPPEEIIPWHLYAPYFSPEEQAALQQLLDALAGPEPLAGEIQTARIMLRRLLAHMAGLGELNTDAIIRLTPLVLTTTQTIARLLKEQRALQPDGPDSFDVVMTGVLRDLGDEWDIDLLGDGTGPP